MKTKNVILIGALLGLGYVMYKNSKAKASSSNSTTDDSSGGGGSSAPGGYEGLSYHPIIPGMSNPTPGPIEVVVTPLPPKPVKTRVTINSLQQVQEASDLPKPNVTNTPSPVSTNVEEPLVKTTTNDLYLKK